MVATGWYALRNPDRFIPQITAYVQQQTGLEAHIRHIEIHLFPALLVRAYDVEIENPRPFPSGDFLHVPRLDVTIARIPLLRGQIAIPSLVLYKPAIHFISDPDGLWNGQDPSGPKGTPARFSMGAISSLQIEDGVLLGSNLINPTDAPGPIVLELGNFSAQLHVVRAHPPSAPGASEPIAGSLTAATARFGSIRTKNLRSQLGITSERLTFKNFATKTYHGQASGDFVLDFGGKNTRFETSLRVNGIGVPYLLAEFQNGAPKMTGMMQAELSLVGAITHTSHPLAGIQGTGHVTIRKGELPTLDRNQDMINMERFRAAGTGALPASAFSLLAGDMTLRNNRIYSQRIAADFYGTDVVGSGNTSVLDGAVDYRGVATVLKKQGFFTSLFARMFKQAHEKNGRLTFFLRITGTLAHPSGSVVEGGNPQNP